jgi:hypothetical protein
VKTSLSAPHRYILFPGSELVSCDTVKSFAAQAKIGKSFADQRKSFTARHGKLKSREVKFFSGASEKQSTVRHLSILNFHCTLCCDLIDYDLHKCDFCNVTKLKRAFTNAQLT